MENKKPVVDSTDTYQATLEPVWIKEIEYPFLATIKRTDVVRGKFGGDDIRLTLESNGEIRTFDAWRDNKNALIYLFGPRISDWIGKEIHISLGANKKRVISVVLGQGTA